MEILNKTKDINTVLFYIHETVMHRWAKKERHHLWLRQTANIKVRGKANPNQY